MEEEEEEEGLMTHIGDRHQGADKMQNEFLLNVH